MATAQQGEANLRPRPNVGRKFKFEVQHLASRLPGRRIALLRRLDSSRLRGRELSLSGSSLALGSVDGFGCSLPGQARVDNPKMFFTQYVQDQGRNVRPAGYALPVARRDGADLNLSACWALNKCS